MYYIVSGTRQEFDAYVRRKALNAKVFHKEFNSKDYCFVHSPEVFLGQREVKGFFIGTYEDRPDIERIREMIKLVKRVNSTSVVYPQLFVDGVLRSDLNYDIICKTDIQKNVMNITVRFNPALPADSLLSLVDKFGVGHARVCDGTTTLFNFSVPL